MERSLQGRVAVVTGAGVRLGRAIAEGLGARGARLVVHCHQSRAVVDDAGVSGGDGPAIGLECGPIYKDILR